MNAKSLQLLSQKKQGVEVILFTENGRGRNRYIIVVHPVKMQGRNCVLLIKLKIQQCFIQSSIIYFQEQIK